MLGHIVAVVDGSLQADVLMLSGFVEDVPHDSVTEGDNQGEVLAGQVGLQHVVQRRLSEVEVLDFGQLAYVVLKLVALKLPQVIVAQNHVVNELGYLLVEFDHVWLPMDEVLD